MQQPAQRRPSAQALDVPAPDSPRAQSSALTPGHLEIFTRLGIGLGLLTAAGVRSVTDWEAREFGFELSPASSLTGILFLYCDPLSGQHVTSRLRRDCPDVGPSSKTQRKYLSPYGDNRHLYFAPGAAALLADTAVSAVFVEAEKSALAFTALAERVGRKFLVIGTGGCWGWRGKVRLETGPHGHRQAVHGPLPDLDRISLRGRDCLICFDANCSTNPRVRVARRALAEELTARGASIRIADLPQLEGINGPDDLIAASGDEAMLALLDSARPFAEAAAKEAEATVAALEADTKQDPAPTLEAIAAVPNPLCRTLLAGRIAVLGVPGLTKRVIEQAVEQERKRAGERQREAVETTRREQLLHLSVTPPELIGDLEAYYSRRRHLPADAAFVEALFCLNTYVFEVFDTTPYLLYESATGGCGKTTSLEYHEAVCARAYLGVDPSAAALYRKIDRDQPTWLLDEAALLHTHGDRARELLAIFDAGYKSGATVSRCEDHGEGIRDFNVYCPKVLSQIGGFHGTLLDRGIVIHLEKARRLPQTRRKVLLKEATPLRRALKAYALQYRAKLERLYDREPEEGYWPELSGREEQVWGPLLTHARLAGPEIGGRAVRVALSFSRGKAEIAVAEDRNLALTQEAVEVLERLGSETFSPSDLVAVLSGKEAWGADLAERKSDKARVSAVGKFFSRFRLPSRKHTAAGTQYSRLEAIEVLGRHTPDVRIFSEAVNVSGGETTAKESIDSVYETSQDKVSTRQPFQNKEPAAPTDTLTFPLRDHAVGELHHQREKTTHLLETRSPVPEVPPGVRLLGWSLKQAPVAIACGLVVTNPALFASSTLEQLKVALVQPKRRVGWTVEQLIDRLHQIGVEMALEPTSSTSHQRLQLEGGIQS